MKVKVVFECEIYPTDYTPWFTVNDELKHTGFDCVNNLSVFDAETGGRTLRQEQNDGYP